MVKPRFSFDYALMFTDKERQAMEEHKRMEYRQMRAMDKAFTGKTK